jgi:nicotinic acid mononucleotide adenylyltransferase
MALKTVIPNEGKDVVKTTSIHFRVKKSIKGQELNRLAAGSYVSATAFWLLKAMLLGDYDSWANAVDSFPFKNAISINIVNDPRITLEEHLSIADFTNPLVYHNGKFERPIEYTRKYEKYIGGSFNPPHATHFLAGKDAMFVINFENARKDTVSLKDMAHRIRMLDTAGVPVMIMKERPFTSLQAHMLHKLGRDTMTIVTGVDTFNAICNTKYTPAHDELFEPLDEAQEKEAREQILSDFLQPLYETAGVTFEVLKRDGHELVDNQWTERMKIELIDSHDESVSSTTAREGDHSDLTPEISEYIKEHNLYSA